MKTLLFLFLSVVSVSAFAHLKPQFMEEHVIRRERVEEMIPASQESKKQELEYMILRDGTLWVREIANNKVKQLPKLIPLGHNLAQEFVTFRGHLFLITQNASNSRMFLAELNSVGAQKSNAWMWGTIFNSGAGGMALYLGSSNFLNGHYFLSAIELALGGYFTYRGYQTYTQEAPDTPKHFFNPFLRDTNGDPLTVVDMRLNNLDSSVEEIILTSPSQILPIRLSNLISDKNCNSDLKAVDSPPLVP